MESVEDLKRKLNNYSMIIDTKFKKIEKLEKRNAKLEKNILKLKNTTRSSKKVYDVEENKISCNYQCLIIDKDLDIKKYKVRKEYTLDIQLNVSINEVKDYIENIAQNEKELSIYIEKYEYRIWKIENKNNEWILSILKKELQNDDISNIEFNNQSCIIGDLEDSKNYVLSKYYTLPIPKENSLQYVKSYIENSKMTNIELNYQKNMPNSIAWKILIKNNKWVIIFKQII